MTTGRLGAASDPPEWRVFLIGLRCLPPSIIAVFLTFWLPTLLGPGEFIIDYESPRFGPVLTTVYAILAAVFLTGLGLCCFAPDGVPGRRFGRASFALALTGTGLSIVVLGLQSLEGRLWAPLRMIVPPPILHPVFRCMLIVNWLLVVMTLLLMIRSIGQQCEDCELSRSAGRCMIWFGIWACSMPVWIWLPAGDVPAARVLVRSVLLWIVVIAIILHFWWVMLLHDLAARIVTNCGRPADRADKIAHH